MMCSSLDAVEQLQQAACNLSAACRARLGISETDMPSFALHNGVILEAAPNGIDALLEPTGISNCRPQNRAGCGDANRILLILRKGE